jgi:hypothetical protein
MEQESMGTCKKCGQEFDKKAMRTHLSQCVPSPKAGAEETIIQLLVEAPGMPEYWLYVEGKASASLDPLDQFLRDIWVECCEHLSAFSEKRQEVPWRTKLGDYFSRTNRKIDYEYDFGSTTELTIKAVGRRQGALGRSAIELLARNNPLPWKCSKCGKPAEVLCQYCMEEDSFFCAEHAEEHGCASSDEYLPVVNSPRMGVCGYTGD